MRRHVQAIVHHRAFVGGSTANEARPFGYPSARAIHDALKYSWRLIHPSALLLQVDQHPKKRYGTGHGQLSNGSLRCHLGISADLFKDLLTLETPTVAEPELGLSHFRARYPKRFLD